MMRRANLDAFLDPASVAVVGATERPGSWGSFIMGGLLSKSFPGKIYPVNRGAGEVFGLKAYPRLMEIPGTVDLVVITVPEASVEEVMHDCAEKGVRGITLITAGYSEAVDEGKDKESRIVELARTRGIRVLGPNVSGTFNLHARFNGSASPAEYLFKTPLAAVCQGGFAFYDLLASGHPERMGVGQFVHTGNECDLTVTDFLDYFGEDPDTQGIVMYLESIRDGKRFAEAASRVSRRKPIVVYKGGKTAGGARAARSHTGALAGSRAVYDALFRQCGIVSSPSMELLLPLAHALVERPAMQGKRVAVVTMGGSWGVALSDALEQAGLHVCELGAGLQKRLRDLGMPVRASTRNPVDIGASGLYYDADLMVRLGEEIITSGEADAMVLHGVGRAGFVTEETPEPRKIFAEINKKIIRGFHALEKEANRPVLVAGRHGVLRSQEVHDVAEEGIRVCTRLDEIAWILRCLEWRSRRREGRG